MEGLAGAHPWVGGATKLWGRLSGYFFHRPATPRSKLRLLRGNEKRPPMAACPKLWRRWRDWLAPIPGRGGYKALGPPFRLFFRRPATPRSKLRLLRGNEKRPPMAACPKALAEMEGFEPPVPLRVHRISSAARSTTLAHLHFCGNKDKEKNISSWPEK